jgi:hypothetical protein
MRVLIAAATAASLLVSSAFAATDTVAPLAPGKPAGVKKAQLAESTTLLWVLGAGLVIGGIALVATQGDNNNNTSSGGSSSSSSSP